MKTVQLIILASYFSSTLAAFSLLGPHGDGRFLANTADASLKACAAGTYHSLQIDAVSGGFANFDTAANGGAGAWGVDASRCLACSKKIDDATEARYKIGIIASVLTASGQQAAGLRGKCCANSDHPVCLEQLRAYKEGCDSTGAQSGSNLAGYGTASVCAV